MFCHQMAFFVEEGVNSFDALARVCTSSEEVSDRQTDSSDDGFSFAPLVAVDQRPAVSTFGYAERLLPLVGMGGAESGPFGGGLGLANADQTS